MQDQDMKFLVRGFVRWLLRIGLGLNLILWLAVLTIYCQDHRSQHKERLEQEDESGFMFVVVTEKLGDIVYLYRESKFETRIQKFAWDKESVIQDKAKKQFSGCYLAMFCRKHDYLYVLQRQPCLDNPGPVIFRGG